MRCDEQLFETFDANGDAKNTQECCTAEHPCGAGEGGKFRCVNNSIYLPQTADQVPPAWKTATITTTTGNS